MSKIPELREGEQAIEFTDYDKAVEIAAASKRQRLLVVAGRLIDEVLKPYVVDGRPRVFGIDAAMAESLMSLYKRFPDAFNHVYGPGLSKLDLTKGEDMLEALPVILDHGGLPLTATESGWSKRRLTQEELEETAELREKVASAIYDSPPSNDFIQDYKLIDYRYIDYRKDAVSAVLSFKESAEYHEARANECERYTQGDVDRLHDDEAFSEKGDLIRSTRMTQIHGLLTDVVLNVKDSSFTEEARNLVNNFNATVEDVMNLWLKGRELVAANYRVKAMESMSVYDAVMSGEAATYQSPKKKRAD